jgi:5-methylcytosine-specific restriction endonuclease McrA
MAQKVLVLNQDYSAFSICSATKAFLLVFLQKAEIVNSSLHLQLHTVSHSFPYPTVIRLFKYVYVPYKGIELSRQNVFKRDRNMCQYCGSTHNLTLDHVIPKSKGGKTSWENLITACQRCNSNKGHQTPEQAGLTIKIKPYKPSFIMFLRDFSGNLDDSWLPFIAKVSSKHLT